MRFSLNFIREFLDVDLPASQIADKLTMAGMEVERLEKAKGDWLFDIEVTTNRYDWLSMAGIARELGAVLGKKAEIKLPFREKKTSLTEKKIIIENHKDCPFYIGREIINVRVGQADQNLRELLINCGISSVNNIVDITNYCMLKWGNPLHAFDSDKIEGDIYVRRAKTQEVFIGIDGKERVLNKENLVIADSKKVIALAGVMGAKNTEVDGSTKKVFLEAAIFSPITVRRSRRAAGLDTESSYRFERMVSGDYLDYAALEASKLIIESGGGNLTALRRAGKKPFSAEKKIELDLKRLDSYLGVCIPKKDIKKILTALGFSFGNELKDKLKVISPAHRFDIQREVDIYEEISRIWGYGKIPSEIPFLSAYASKKEAIKDSREEIYHFKNKLRELMALLKFREIITYSIDDQDTFLMKPESEIVKISNPLKKQENILRANLLLGMAKSVRHNLNRGQSSLSFFEIADTYSKLKDRFIEKPALAFGISGNFNDFFKLRAAVEALFNYLDIGNFFFKEVSLENFTNALEVIVDKKSVGFLGKLDNSQKDAFDLKEDLFFGQLDVDFLAEGSGKKEFRAFSSYPALWRDISISLRKDVKFKEIQKIIKETGSHLSGLQIIEFYKGKDIHKDWTAFTLRIFYQSSKRTLTAQEVDTFHGNIRNKLNLKDGINLR